MKTIDFDELKASIRGALACEDFTEEESKVLALKIANKLHREDFLMPIKSKVAVLGTAILQ